MSFHISDFPSDFNIEVPHSQLWSHPILFIKNDKYWAAYVPGLGSRHERTIARLQSLCQNLKVHVEVGSAFVEIDKQENVSGMTYEDALTTLQSLANMYSGLIQPVDTLDVPCSPSLL